MGQATKISIENAKSNKLFYVVPNAVVYRPSDGRCLLLKRGDDEKVFPGLWATQGGKMDQNDYDMAKPDRVLAGDVVNFVNPVGKLLAREIKEEANIEVDEDVVYTGKNILAVRPDEIPVLFMLFAAVYKSGEVKFEAGAFTDSVWVNAEEVKSYDCIEGIHDEVAEVIKLNAKK